MRPQLFVLAFVTLVSFGAAAPPPDPPGRLIDVGGHRLHLNCTGQGGPTVVVETGLGDYSFDWVLVQSRVAAFARVCTYDRAGYAWSDVGPTPRTFDQLNFELHEALARAGERGPYVLVGHSFGGGVVRQYALRYPDDVGGLVLAEMVAEDQYIRMGPHAGRIRDDARGRPIPEPIATFTPPASTAAAAKPAPLDRLYELLPAREKGWHTWAAAQPYWEPAEDSQKAWSAEYYARWSRTSQAGGLGARPLIVLTRARGGYADGLDLPAAELERVRMAAQQALATLSTSGEQRIIDAGHNLHLEAPADVERAVRDVVTAVRQQRPAREDSPEAVVRAFFEAGSGPAGRRDVARMRTLFAAAGRITTARRGGTDNPQLYARDVETYIREQADWVATNASYEHLRTAWSEQYGNFAQVSCAFEATRSSSADETPFFRGVGSFQLFFDGRRWLIVSALWQGELPGRPLSPRYFERR